MNAYWRAANYLSVGQIYLFDNPLLREPLTIDHVKRRLLGHWGTTPGLNFIYLHLNRLIRKADLNVIDFDRLCLHPPQVTYDLPGGGRRLVQRADGYRATVVSGAVVYRDGEPTGELPGRLVRGPQQAPDADAFGL